MKKHESNLPDQANTSNNSTEVFVLPPDLLAKLGINLSKSQNLEVQSTVTDSVKGSDQIINQGSPTTLPDEKDISSIIETANLMKESVFLSPTFLQNASNVAPYEGVSLVNEYDNTTPYQNCDMPISRNAEVNNVSATEQKIEITNENVNVHSNIENCRKLLSNIKLPENMIVEYQVENQGGNLILTDIANSENSIVTEHRTKAISSIDEHPDEAYMSDCSNSYSGCSSETLQFEVKQKSTLINKIKEDERSDELIMLEDLQVSSSNSIYSQVTVNSITEIKDDNVNITKDITPDEPEIIFTKHIIERPVVVFDNIKNIENPNCYSADIKSPENIISWTPMDKREKEIKVTMIEYGACNNSIIHINESLAEINPSHETITDIVDSHCEQSLHSKECTSDSSDDELLSTVKMNMNKAVDEMLAKDKSETKSGHVSTSKNFTTERIHIDEVQSLIPTDELLSNAKIKTENIVHNFNKNQKKKYIEETNNIFNEIKSSKMACTISVTEHSNQMSEEIDQLSSTCPDTVNNHNVNKSNNDVELSEKIEIHNLDNKYNKKKNISTEMVKVDYTKENISTNFRNTNASQPSSFIDSSLLTAQNKGTSNVDSMSQIENDKVVCNKYNNGPNQKIKLSSETSQIQNKGGPNMISEINNVAEDRVREIAALLTQITERKKLFKNKNKKQVNIPVASKVEPAKSKLYKQGVEKPGGFLVCGKVTKTYQRTIMRKEIPALIAISKDILNSDSFQLSINHDQEVQVATSKSENKFCICYDFGSLAYYDCEMLYEHIHFWQHKNIHCDSKIIHSIYNDDCIISESKEIVDLIKDVSQTENDETTMTDDNVCWNNILTENKDKTIGSTTSDKEPNVTIYEQANSKQAKQSLVSSESKEDKSQKDDDDIALRARNRKRSSAVMDLASKTGQEFELNTSTPLTPSKSRRSRKSNKSKDKQTSIASTSTKNTSRTEIDGLPKLIKDSTKLAIDASVRNTRTSVDIPPKLLDSSAHLTTDVHSHFTRRKSNLDGDSMMSITVLTKKHTEEDTSKKIPARGKSCDITATRSTRRTSNIETESIKQVTDNLKVNSDSIYKKKSKRGESSRKPLNITMDVSSSSVYTQKTDKGKKTDKDTESEILSMLPETETSNLSKKKSLTSDTNPLPQSKVIDTTCARSTTKYVNAEVSEPLKTYKRSSSCVTDSTSVKKSKQAANETLSTKTNINEMCNLEIQKDKPNVSVVTNITVPEVIERSVPKKQSTANVDGKTTDASETDVPFINREINPSKLIENRKNTLITKQGKADNEARIKSKNHRMEPNHTKGKGAPTNMAIVDLTDPTNDESTSAETSRIYIEVEVPGNSVKCGVCAKSIAEAKWIEHISERHNYLAWRDGEQALDFKSAKALREHLLNIVKQTEKLICANCGLIRKFPKPFLRHIINCKVAKHGKKVSVTCNDLNLTLEPDEDMPLSAIKSESSRGKRKSTVLPPVTCGVCKKTVEQASWIEHIRVEHKYMAWSSDETPLNVDDEDEVKSHLNYIAKYHGGLICSKCGAKWSYPKKYMLHEKLCDGSRHSQVKNKTIEVEIPMVVTCGVCKLEVKGDEWINHIMRAHEYMAWIDGEEPIDTDNDEQVKQHLYKIVKMAGELICMKCGISRRYERAYRQHIAYCTNTDFDPNVCEPAALDKDHFECAICHEKGNLNKWKKHAMSKHYNIAWMVGEIPINLRNPYAVEKYLKEYQKKHVSLVCKVCKSSRTSCYGFYAHIMTCGKNDQELQAVHDLCEICKKKYLCIYKNQHVAMHRDQEIKKERKELNAKKAEVEAQLQREMQHEQPVGKRKAAQKAKKVIQKHTSNIIDGKQVCQCGKMFENEADKSQHNCKQQHRAEDDASDVTVKMEPVSGAESADSDLEIESASEDEREDTTPKKRVRVYESTTKVTRMSYRVSNYMSYLIKGFKNFCDQHYSTESLFNEWPVSDYNVISSCDLPMYLPPMTESCKVRFGHDSQMWTTYERFEAKKCKGYSLFAGGAIQCISWAPPNMADETLGNYLAVSTHRGPDVPRLGPYETIQHPGLLQIWDFQQFNFLPRLNLALAHEYGVVWAMDWCPSGCRDAIPTEWNGNLSRYRLGLLAIACSNGKAYILAVPYPPPDSDGDMAVYQLKPVAELRLSMSSERQVYQATTVSWSHQKGHSIIIVGYSDGSTALYDLHTESPFLKTIENGTTVYFPFQDKRTESSPITGVGICPTSNESYSMGGICSTSITGGSMTGWPSAAPSVRCHLAISGAHYSPHWPAVLLSGDSPFTVKSVNEVEWWGGGRRLGAARASAACARCGRVCAAAAPAVRLLHAHPCYPEIRKQLVATVLMVPFNQSRKRKANDDLSMVVEPLTYEDAIAIYGLQMTLVSKTEQVEAQKVCNENELSPERFPLSDIVATAFCPSTRFHDKVTIATHAGIIFVING